MADVKVGVGWNETSKKGTKYISIRLNDGTRIAMFENDNKNNEKSPDYRLRMDEEDAQKLNLLDDYEKSRVADEAKANAVETVKQTLGATEVEDSDIPF